LGAGIASWVKSLSDFPLDPDRGQAWLWTGDGVRLLWLSDGAADELGASRANGVPQIDHGQSLESFAVELQNLQPDRQPIRVKQLPLAHGRRSELFTCLCRHVPLADGSGFGLLTVAIGAPPRLAANGPAEPRAAGPPADPAPEPVDLPQAAAAAPPPPPVASEPAPAPAPTAPAWTEVEPALRRPLRFVWQTDADGRFAHLSRELIQAVGAPSAMILGKRFRDVAAEFGITETGGIADAFDGVETWTAPAALWPVTGTNLGAPVEMAGMPVRENGAFAGFRGYGIVRIERAVVRPGSAVRALAADAPPEVERREDRFGPTVSRMLDNSPAEPAPNRERVVHPETVPPFQPPAAAEAPASATLAAAEPPPAAATQPSAPATEPAEERSLLTVSERNAFREIARALGSVSPAPTPPAADPGGPPPASPRQMPAWIARRQQVRQEQPTEPAEPPPAPAPVVPFEAFQARLDRRVRDPQQAAGILDKLPIAVLVMQQGKPVYGNAAFLELAGQKDFPAFVAAGGADAFFEARPPDAATGPASTITVRDRTGRSIAVEAHAQTASWEDAPATLMTFRRQARQTQAAARAAEAKALELDLAAARAELQELRFVLDTAIDGVLSLDAQGRILAVNRSAEALFGFDQNEIAGEPFTVLLEPDSHPAALDYLEGLKTGGVATIMNDGREVKGRERHGGRIPLFMTLGRMGSGDGARFCAVLRDVTIWKKAEAELTDARRAAEDSSANKTDFLARVSHEIRTPMNAIIGFADVMRSETFGPIGNEKYRGYINDIHASGQHVVSLVNDLLDLSKVAAGKLDLTFGSVDLNKAVGAAVSMIQPQANAGQLIVRTQLATRLPPVVADERSVRQIVLNLLSNAAKFTEAGGQVIVTTALTERGEAVIRVRDTGIGMTEEDLKRAVEPFRQIPGPKASGGTGLGLPLTKALAEANRAAFQISSEPGRGTLAEIVFPSTRVLAE
jgi:PAS domain S-box-containing protein